MTVPIRPSGHGGGVERDLNVFIIFSVNDEFFTLLSSRVLKESTSQRVRIYMIHESCHDLPIFRTQVPLLIARI